METNCKNKSVLYACEHEKYNREVTTTGTQMAESADEKADCTAEQLRDIITFPCGGLTMLPSKAIDEVFPNIFIGEESASREISTLKKHHITHVLNAAKGKDRYHVNTNADLYKPAGIEFMGVEATDTMNFQICKLFEKTTDFISKALSQGGKILVHCREGVSRSATIVIAYLMMKEKMSVCDAVRIVRSSREICPNDGFLEQLCDLDRLLQQKRNG